MPFSLDGDAGRLEGVVEPGAGRNGYATKDTVDYNVQSSNQSQQQNKNKP